LKHLWKKTDSIIETGKEYRSKVEFEQTKQWEIIDANYKHWEAEMTLRVKTQTLIAVVGIVLTIVLTMLGLSFRSLSSGVEKTLNAQDTMQGGVTEMQRTVDRMEVQVTSIQERNKTRDSEIARERARDRRRRPTENHE